MSEIKNFSNELLLEIINSRHFPICDIAANILHYRLSSLADEELPASPRMEEFTDG